MVEYVEFPTFLTKGITIEKNDERRIFKGHITAEIIDSEQEFIFVKEVMGIMGEFMKINPVISDEHSNRMVGKVLSYEKSEINGAASVLITAEIYKSEKFQLYDKVWKRICSGEYSGLSMGGASKEREAIQKDGKMALELRKLELYEIAICKSPANAFAIVDYVNTFAKTNGLDQNMIQELDGRNIIQCSSVGCKFEKGTNIDADADVDNSLEQFDKPDKVEKDHIPSTPEKIEEEAKEKIRDDIDGVEKVNSNTLVGRSAETRSAGVAATGSVSPKDVNDVLNQINDVLNQINAVKKSKSYNEIESLLAKYQ